MRLVLASPVLAALAVLAAALLCGPLGGRAQSLSDPNVRLGVVSTFAGDGSTGSSLVNLPYPYGAVYDSSTGYTYVTSHVYCQVYRISPGGVKTVIAGTYGTCTSTGDGGPASAATLNAPMGLAYDVSNKYLFVGEKARIRRIRLGLSPAIITTIAGTGVAGYNGNNLPATSSRVDTVTSIVTNGYSGQLYFADSNNHRVRRVDFSATPPVVRDIAGTGAAGYGGDGGLAINAVLNRPIGLAQASGFLYVTDYNNNRVRRISAPATPGAATITTFAGTGVAGYSGDGGSPAAAQFNRPTGLALVDQTLLVCDPTNSRIRLIRLGPNAPYITTLVGTGAAAPTGSGRQIPTPASVTQINGCNALVARYPDLSLGQFINVQFGETLGHRFRSLTVPAWGYEAYTATGELRLNRFNPFP